MTQQPTRAERDRAAAQRASEEARALWWQAQQQPTTCGSCGAQVPAQRAEGEPFPCGQPSQPTPSSPPPRGFFFGVTAA